MFGKRLMVLLQINMELLCEDQEFVINENIPVYLRKKAIINYKFRIAGSTTTAISGDANLCNC